MTIIEEIQAKATLLADLRTGDRGAFGFDREHHSLVRETIIEQLRLEPEVESRNRKPLRRPVVAESEWEIRFGHQNRFRVFYRVRSNPRQIEILAIGVKVGKNLIIGGQKIES